MPTPLPGARHWHYTGDSALETAFGPLRGVAFRVWGATPEPEGYRGYLTTRAGDVLPGSTAFVPTAALGVAWHDDKADLAAVRALEKRLKAVLRTWAKPAAPV